MRTLIKVLCGFVLFGATIWIMGAKPSAIDLAGAAVGWAVGYGLGWLGLRAFPRESAPASSFTKSNPDR